MTARNVFDATHEAGARAPEPPMRLTCAAHGCPMPGTITESGSAHGVCVWHAHATSSSWPTITQILGTDWACATQHYLAVRRVLSRAATCMDGKAHQAVLDAGRDLVGIAPGWGLEPGPSEDIGAWGRRLGDFLTSCVAGKPMVQPIGPKPRQERKPVLDDYDEGELTP